VSYRLKVKTLWHIPAIIGIVSSGYKRYVPHVYEHPRIVCYSHVGCRDVIVPQW